MNTEFGMRVAKLARGDVAAGGMWVAISAGRIAAYERRWACLTRQLRVAGTRQPHGHDPLGGNQDETAALST